MTEGTTTTQGLSRRTLARGAAWTVPAIGLAAAAPALAASPDICTQDCINVQFGVGLWDTRARVLGGTEVHVYMPLGITFTCSSFWGSVFGGWALASTRMTITTTDSGTIVRDKLLVIPGIQLGWAAQTVDEYVAFPDYVWDDPSDNGPWGLDNIGQTAAHHITNICIDLTFFFFSLIDGVEATQCNKQVCLPTTAGLLGWNSGTFSGATITNA